MRTITQQFETAMLEELAKKGMGGKVVEDAATGILQVLARPDLGRCVTPPRYTVPHWETRRPSWHSCWWARLLRWIVERVFQRTRTSLKSPFPAWLRDLLYAYEVDLGAKVESLPVDILERIRVMQHYLTCCRWEAPTKVVMGPRAFVELRGACISHFPDALTFSQDLGGRVQIFGLKVQINPFLAEDAVFVC